MPPPRPSLGELRIAGTLAGARLRRGDRTAAALDQVGLPPSRIREAGSVRQGFRRLGPAILELVETSQQPPGPARFWGLVVIVEDLAGLSTAVAFMTPERAED